MSRPADEKEVEVLEKFRTAVRDLLPPDKIRDDSYLLRWIRARDRDLDKALFMLKTSLDWRKTNNIDSIVWEMIPEDFNGYFNCHFGGIDKHGRLIICAPVGEWDFRGWLDQGRKEDLVRFLAQTLEILDLTMREMWKNQFPQKTKWPHTQFMVIMDLTGFSYAKMMHKKSIDTLLEVTKMYEANYPETLACAVIINAPWIFSTLYSMIRPLLSEHTASKIKIFNNKEATWKKAILETVEEDQIPPQYGGCLNSYSPI